MNTRVASSGRAPAGLPLSQLLHNEGIDNIDLERRGRACMAYIRQARAAQITLTDTHAGLPFWHWQLGGHSQYIGEP
jgi:hypothetical protein